MASRGGGGFTDDPPILRRPPVEDPGYVSDPPTRNGHRGLVHDWRVGQLVKGT